MRKKKGKSRRASTWFAAAGIAGAVSIVAVIIYAAFQYRTQPDATRPLEIALESDTAVYASIGLEKEVIGRAQSGHWYTITGRDVSGMWAEIDYNGQPGWIHSRPGSDPGLLLDIPVKGMDGIMVGTIDGPDQFINMFSDADKNSDVSGKLIHGDEIVFVGRHEKAGWIFVQSGDRQGWAYLLDSPISGDVTDFSFLPVIEAAPTPSP